MSCYGTEPLTIRTLHGCYVFDNQRYISDTGSFENFLSSSDSDSKGVRELFCYYSTKMPFREVGGLLERFTGKSVYSTSHLPKLVKAESDLALSYLRTVDSGSQLSFNFVETVSIYEKEAVEVLYFDDAIGVKRQNEVRRVPWAAGNKSSATVQTDVVVIGNEQTGFTYLSSAEASARALSLEDLIHIRLSQRYGSAPIPIVAVTDGGRTIRLRLWSLFGESVVILLDWYHLKEKIWAYLSQMALPKSLKTTCGEDLCYLLWRGQVGEAIGYLEYLVHTKKTGVVCEFQAYLEKHKAEICNYQKRQEAGKTIGSGRGEKANDQLVACRQKKKAMSWSVEGSNALTILQTLQTNQKWQNYWAYAA